MSGKTAKAERKAQKQITLDGVEHLDVLPAPQLQSFLHGFLVSRGFDLSPLIGRADGQLIVDLYQDKGSSGFDRVARIALDESKIEGPKQISVSIGVVGRLYASLQPRTPSPMDEMQLRQLRNGLIGALQDGVDEDDLLMLLNNIVGQMTGCLRKGPMHVRGELPATATVQIVPGEGDEETTEGDEKQLGEPRLIHYDGELVGFMTDDEPMECAAVTAPQKLAQEAWVEAGRPVEPVEES